MGMKKKKTAKLLLTLCLMLVLASAVHPVSASAAALKTDHSVHVVNQFGNDPATERNFAWQTPNTITSGQLEYCLKSGFTDFNKNKFSTAGAFSWSINTGEGLRMVHKVSVKNLKPGAEYIYRIRFGKSTVTPSGTFRTASAEASAFTFLQITDTQGSDAEDYQLWKKTLDTALKDFPDAAFLLHTGDIVDSGQSIRQWDLFVSAAGPELMQLPIEPAVGNHEAVNSNGINPSDKFFTDRFNLPEVSGAGAPPGTVYSFDYGYARVAVLNTECSSDNLKKEGEWLLADMKRSKKPWKIVALHRGLYGATYDSATTRKILAPVFDQAGIDLVLQGHDHNYVRSFPIKGNKIVKSGTGTVYVTANSGGIKFYPKKTRSWQQICLQPNLQTFLAVTVEEKQLTAKAFDVNHKLIDSFNLSY